MPTRRTFAFGLSGLTAIGLGAALWQVGGTAPAVAQAAPESAPVMHVMKSPTCGCCGAWVALARGHGYRVEVEETTDFEAMKAAGDVPDHLWGCHTAQIGDYTVEGHVPFDALRRLLVHAPAVDGIAVPGMPIGSPGMGNDPSTVYDVIAYGGAAGDGEVFHTAGQ